MMTLTQMWKAEMSLWSGEMLALSVSRPTADVYRILRTYQNARDKMRMRMQGTRTRIQGGEIKEERKGNGSGS